MAFSFSIPQQVTFGNGSLGKLAEVSKKLNKRKAFIISGPHLNKIGLVEACRNSLTAEKIECDVFTETEGNPSTETVNKAVESYRNSGADFIVAIGGGSPIDVAKAVAVLAVFGGQITDYEGSGKISGPVVPVIAIPTTAGTGSEVTAFSVITDHNRNYKLTVASNYLLPAYVILDPMLIKSVPEQIAAACGVDALVHALEAYISKAASPFSDLFAKRALELIGENIRTYVADRNDETAAESMLLGSLFAGIAFSHARLGNVHAMSHPVSAFFNVAHGVANAILLPVVVEFNAVTDNGKYYEIYQCVSENPVMRQDFCTKMLVEELCKLNMQLGIPSGLREVGVTEALFHTMAEDAMKSGNIAVNPRSTTLDDLLQLYAKAF
ncbi:MAG: iron-containing alcohol dehydrogenase [Muribaculaceae bacterium]|nr:iron-containing alcohol dehydrogenase [Muribaculaceae bacterium]MCM1398994.1 iron-containing alcohol dehydrogenase [Clostridium sp.]MCM1458852.1 iron-containing alcohol dehydrogenase [Bacteroides sp.]